MKNIDAMRQLPVRWQWKMLKDIGPLVDGDWILNSDYSTDGVRLLQVGDIGNGRFLGKSSRYITQARANELKCTFIKPGDVLISRMPDPIGRACKMPDLGYPSITAVDVSIWRPLPEIANTDYLVYTLSCEDWFDQVLTLASGATRPRISRTKLEELTIPLPPLAEQQRIAAALRQQMAAVEQARAAAQARLEAIKTLPATFLRQVFPQPGLPLPNGWRLVKLGDVIEQAQNGFASGQRDPNGVAQLRMNNLDTRGNFVWDEVLRVPYEANNIEQFLLLPGDVVFNNTNSTELVGKSALFEGYIEPITFSNHFTRLRPVIDCLLPNFLASWLNHQWQQGVFAAICNRWIGQSAVKADKLLSLNFPLPPLAEQQRIAAALREQMAAVEQARAAADEELNTINTLPAALLRRAFNGEL